MVREAGIGRVAASNKGIEKRVAIRVASRVEIFDHNLKRQLLIIQREAEPFLRSAQQVAKRLVGQFGE